ncbi:MAG: hypothetical protein PGN13_07450 [Patulibacter minatonensis]
MRRRRSMTLLAAAVLAGCGGSAGPEEFGRIAADVQGRCGPGVSLTDVIPESRWQGTDQQVAVQCGPADSDLALLIVGRWRSRAELDRSLPELPARIERVCVVGRYAILASIEQQLSTKQIEDGRENSAQDERLRSEFCRRARGTQVRPRHAGSPATDPVTSRAAATDPVTSRAAAADPQLPPRCGFPEINDHEITFRRGLSCDGAKRVLRTLKGGHDFVPMACGRPRVVGGWQLRNLRRNPTSLMTEYRRGRRAIHYFRFQDPQNQTCPPKTPFEFDEPDA